MIVAVVVFVSVLYLVSLRRCKKVAKRCTLAGALGGQEEGETHDSRQGASMEMMPPSRWGLLLLLIFDYLIFFSIVLPAIENSENKREREMLLLEIRLKILIFQNLYSLSYSFTTFFFIATEDAHQQIQWVFAWQRTA